VVTNNRSYPGILALLECPDPCVSHANTVAVTEQKQTLLKTLSLYRVSPYIVQSNENRGSLENLVQTALLIHICHLYGAGDLMDWLPALIRTSGSNKAARKRMIDWGQEDPVRLRWVTYHSAQIVALCRDFPFNSPYEGFFLFYAAAALWCGAKILSTVMAPPTSGTVLFIDKHLGESDFQASPIFRWINGEEDYQVGVYGVPLLRSTASSEQVLTECIRVLRNIRIWDVVRGFEKALMRLTQAEEASGRGA
jgi:hypothetical protein